MRELVGTSRRNASEGQPMMTVPSPRPKREASSTMRLRFAAILVLVLTSVASAREPLASDDPELLYHDPDIVELNARD